MKRKWFYTPAAALIVLSGCTQPAAVNQQPNPITPIAQNGDKTAAPSKSDGTIGSAEALAIKTQNWANELDGMMAKKAVKNAGTEPTQAEFLKPGEFRIGQDSTGNSAKTDKPPTVIAIANPIVETTPSHANQGTSVVADTALQTPAATRVFGDSRNDKRPVEVDLHARDLETNLAKQIRDNPKDLWAHLDYQMLQFLKDKSVPQMDVLSRLPVEDRELLAAVMDGMTNFRNAIRADNNMLNSKKVRPILELADRIRNQADLIIPAVALCTRVDGFGVYEPVDPARFVAMREHPIIVYCEVENFASRMNDKRTWETKLSQEVVLYTETGLPIWQDKIDNIIDHARRRRHDFFVVKKTRLPANIAIGRYLLKVTIVDQQASRVAEATIPVQFVAQ